MGHHDVLLTELRKTFKVRLLARYKNDFAPIGFDKYLHVFVPDMHLITEARRKKYNYGFNSAAMFESLCDSLVKVRNQLPANQFHATQLGDFLDLWRQGGDAKDAVNDILTDFPAVEKKFLDVGAESVGPKLLLGNHDLETREHPSFARARFSHFLTGWGTSALVTHGDAFDWLEKLLDDTIQAIALRTFIGRGADPQEYLQKGLLTFRQEDRAETGEKLVDGLDARIQGDAALAFVEKVNPEALSEFNVIRIVKDDDDERNGKHRLLPNMVKTVKRYRNDTLKGAVEPEAPDLKVVVIGHSHHARLIVDEPTNLVLVDCGAWVESFSAPGIPKTPNRQLGAICGPDFRIYQLDPI